MLRHFDQSRSGLSGTASPPPLNRYDMLSRICRQKHDGRYLLHIYFFAGTSCLVKGREEGTQPRKSDQIRSDNSGLKGKFSRVACIGKGGMSLTSLYFWWPSGRVYKWTLGGWLLCRARQGLMTTRRGQSAISVVVRLSPHGSEALSPIE